MGAATTTMIQMAERDLLNEDPETRHLPERDLQAISYIQVFCERFGEKMPNMDETRINFPKIFVYEEYKRRYSDSGKKNYDSTNLDVCVSESQFYKLWDDYSANISPCRWKGDHCVCDICKRFAQIICNPTLSNSQKLEEKEKKRTHMKTVESCRMSYHYRRQLSCDSPAQYMSIICDATNQNATILPNIPKFSKTEDRFRSVMLKHKLMGVRVHGYKKRDYLYFAPSFLGAEVGSNYTIEAIGRTLVHEEEYRRERSMGWPSVLFVQLDNTTSDNKNKYVFGYLTHLVDSGIFKKVYVSFLPVGHTHEDIDQCFSVIQKALAKREAFTFEEWAELVHESFKQDFNKIYRIEYVWAVNDYRKWMEESPNDLPVRPDYQDYARTAFHFRFQKGKNSEPAVCQSTKWCYHGDYVERTPEYFPNPQKGEIVYSFLHKMFQGVPTTDSRAGTWNEKDGTNRVSINLEERLEKIIQFLRLETNTATEEHVEWWRNFLLASKPIPGIIIPETQIWNFRLPDVDTLRKTCSADFVDEMDIQDAQPEANYTFQVVKTPTFTAHARNKAIEMQKSFEAMLQKADIKAGSFVIFRVQQPEWSQSAEGQTGVDPDVLTTPFGIGQVVVESGRISESETGTSPDEEIGVQVWYAKNGGDPNGVWLPWIKQGEGNRPEKWILRLPRDSVLLADVEFNKRGKHGRVLTAKMKQEISEHPELEFGYLAKRGLVSKDEERQVLEAAVRDTRRGRSSKKIIAHKKATGKLNNSVRREYTIRKLRSEQAKRGKSRKSVHFQKSRNSGSSETPAESYSEHSTDA